MAIDDDADAAASGTDPDQLSHRLGPSSLWRQLTAVVVIQ